MGKNAFGISGLLLIFATAGDALAAPEFVANVSVRTGVTPSFDGGVGKRFASTSEFTPVFVQSAPTIVIQGDTSGRGVARAGLGSLGVYADATQGLQGGTLQCYSNVAETVSFAQFTLHDLMVTPVVVGLPQTFVNLTLRFAVDGQLKIPFSGGSVFDTATLNNFPDGAYRSADTQLLLDARMVAIRSATAGLRGFRRMPPMSGIRLRASRPAARSLDTKPLCRVATLLPSKCFSLVSRSTSCSTWGSTSARMRKVQWVSPRAVACGRAPPGSSSIRP